MIKESFHLLIEKLKVFVKRKDVVVAVTLFSILYTCFLLYLSRNEIRNINWGQSLLTFFYVFLLYFLSHFLQNLAFSILLDRNFSDLSTNTISYYQTILLRHIPGGFWHWLGRYQIFSNKTQKPKQQLISANIYELTILLLTGFSIYISCHNILFGVLFSVIVILVYIYINQYLSKVYRLDLKSLLSVWLIYTICWLLGALKLHLLISQIIASEAWEFINSVSTWTLSSSVSMIGAYLPNMGLFRDLTLTALLYNSMELEKIMLLNAQMRVLFLSFDGVSALVVLTILKLVCFKKLLNH